MPTMARLQLSFRSSVLPSNLLTVCHLILGLVPLGAKHTIGLSVILRVAQHFIYHQSWNLHSVNKNLLIECLF